MKTLYKCINAFFLILLTSHLFAQNIFKGKVVDAKSRQVLENAVIMNTENPKASALSDKYGSFSIKGDRENINLLVSYIGYKPQTIINASSNIIIEMDPDAVNLKDVVLSTGSMNRFNTVAKIDLDLRPVKNTQELLRLVPGLFIAQHAGGGKAEQIFLRGFDCDHGTDVAVSVDGLPVNLVSHAHGQGYADAHFIIPETVHNIDYGTGPYYARQGNLNTAGYVAFSTFDNIPNSRVQVEAGRYNTFRALAMIDLFKKNKDKQSAYLAGEFNYTDGPATNKQNFNRFNLFGKYNLAVSSSSKLTVSGSAFKSKWDASGQVPERAIKDGSIGRFGSIDPSEGGNTERYNVNILFNHRFQNGMTWENQGYYSRNIFNLFSNFTFFLNDPVNGDEINQAEKRNIFGYFSQLRQDKIYTNWTINSTYGGGVRYDATNNSFLSHAVKRQFLNYLKLGDINEINVFAFINKQAKAGNFLINAGVRFDYFHFDYYDKLNAQQMPSQGKSIISPKINVQYTISPQVQLYVKAGKGFHSNDTRVVVENSGKGVLPAVYGADIGINLKPTPSLLLNIAAWYLYLDQEFVYVGDEAVIEPSGKTRREGIDIIVRYQFANNLFANVNLNFTNPRAIDEPKGSDYIPLAPTVTSTGGIFYKRKIGFNGSLTYRYIKNRPANEDNSVVAKGYFLLDGSFNYTKPKYEIGLAIENIANVDWNEAQFDTESRLKNEIDPVSEIHFTPGTPFFPRIKFALFF